MVAKGAVLLPKILVLGGGGGHRGRDATKLLVVVSSPIRDSRRHHRFGCNAHKKPQRLDTKVAGSFANRGCPWGNRRFAATLRSTGPGWPRGVPAWPAGTAARLCVTTRARNRVVMSSLGGRMSRMYRAAVPSISQLMGDMVSELRTICAGDGARAAGSAGGAGAAGGTWDGTGASMKESDGTALTYEPSSGSSCVGELRKKCAGYCRGKA